MTVCKFFLQGNCRFGDKCRNDHPGGGGGNQNSFAALSNQPQDNFRSSNQRGRGRSRGADSFGNHQVRFDNTGGTGGGGFQGGASGRNYYQGGDENVGFGRGRGRSQNNYDQNRQPPSAPRGRGGRGGFQGRGRDRQNNSVNPSDAFGITLAELEDDMTRSKPLWVCSCYGPGRDAPSQLIAGSDLEISPEELRVDHYLKMASGQSADETANIERILSEEMSNRINAIINDPHGAMQYVANAVNDHPNRHDILREVNPSPKEVRWGQFTRDKQRRRQGVFADQQTLLNPGSQGDGMRPGGMSGPAPGAFGQPQNVGLTNFASQQPAAFAVNSFGGNALAQPQQASGAFGQNNPAPMNGGGFGQPAGSGAFGRPTTPFGQSQPITQDDAMLSPTQPSQSGGFGQNGPGGFFSQPALNGNVFGQPQQPQQGPNVFGQPQSQQPFAQPQPVANDSSNIFGGGGFGAQPLQPQPNGNNVFGHPSGTPQPQFSQNAATPPQALTGPQSELKAAYDYMNQHGRFENGIMPETAPEADWIG